MQEISLKFTEGTDRQKVSENKSIKSFMQKKSMTD